MKLRLKFALLAILYIAMLATNVALCSWCLLLYYQSFLNRSDMNPGLGPPRSLASHRFGEGGEWFVFALLGANAVCGIVVGLFGLRQMRRWVIQPVSALREAAVRIGGGDFSWRVQASSRDELGQLAGEVNQMAASIARMQGELVEHERREVAGHALRCIVHNIRSPLTGIRWLAEAISMRKDVDSATVAEQNRIVVTVDHVLEWLQGFRDSLAATSLHLEDVDVLDMVTSAATRCGGAVIERGGRINVSTSGDPRRVRVERVPFEAAISSLVCQTARIDGGALDVHVEVGRPVGRPGHWHIIVEASGPEPSLSAALAGSVSASGEYAMADRVIRLHGGSLEQVADSPSRLRTVILMPG